jgi:hypothetical protein
MATFAKGLSGKYREAKIMAREKMGVRENKTEADELKVSYQATTATHLRK